MRKNLIRTLFLAAVSLIFTGCGDKQPHSLKVMSYNMHIGIGSDGKRNLERIGDIINEYQPDYVGLQEVDNMTTRTGWTDQAAELARMTGMHYVYAPAMEFEGGEYGIAALVKRKPTSWWTLPIKDRDEPRIILVLEYPEYALINTHLPLSESSRRTALGTIMRAARSTGKPVILTGDFNAMPSSPEIAGMEEDWAMLSDPGKYTYPAARPSVTLDYIMGYTGEGARYKASGAKVINAPDASDHLPVYAEIKF